MRVEAGGSVPKANQATRTLHAKSSCELKPSINSLECILTLNAKPCYRFTGIMLHERSTLCGKLRAARNLQRCKDVPSRLLHSEAKEGSMPMNLQCPNVRRTTTASMTMTTTTKLECFSGHGDTGKRPETVLSIFFALA